MKRRTKGSLAAAVAVAAAVVVQVAVASAPQHGTATGGAVVGGVVPVLGSGAAPSVAGGNLTWHGGKVMHANTAYAIYWKPAGTTMSTTYRSTINTFFKDVAAASGLTSNVYFAATQYYDSAGNLAYSDHFGGAYVDTNPFPLSGCVDPGTTVCLSDAQLRAEIDSVIALKGWKRTPKHQFFIFTPRGVGSCFDSGPTTCAFNYYCAYHGSEGGGSNILIYANQPYVGGVGGCDQGQYPNGNDADATINVVSHEHNEAITDPNLDAWYDSQGNENGDKCAWNFGPLSGPSGAEYNQTINGHHYFLQQEWSNAGSHCVQTGT